jgi:hypothetical protein
MENQKIEIGSRVFHIDNECYIVYLGSDRDDYKPFLRIGNSQSLTQKIIHHVYNIVVTDSYTGNPAIEQGNINKQKPEENRYVGDRQTVRRFLDFLKNYLPETDKILQYQDIQIKERGAVVSFYDDGNVQLFYDKHPIFDLKNREKRDLHFVERSKSIADQLSRDALRYRPADFKQPGFCIIDGATLLFNRERLLAVGLPPDYFTALVQYGIDPDLISGIVTEDATEAVMELFKRKQYRREPIVVLTMNVGLLKDALSLFESAGGKPQSSRVVDLRKGKKESLLEYSISIQDARLLFTQKKLPFTVSISASSSAGEENFLSIDPERSILTIKGGTRRIAEGIPYVFEGDPPLTNRITESYFSELFGFVSALLSPGEIVAAKHIEKFLSDVESDSRFSTSFKNAKNGLRKIPKTAKSELFFLLSNAQEVCSLLGKSKAANPDAAGALNAIRARLLKATGSFKSVCAPLPLLCMIHHHNDAIFSFFTLMRETVTHDEYSITLDMRRSTEERRIEKAEFYQQERERLNTLIDELKLPLPPEEKKQVQIEQKAQEAVQRREAAGKKKRIRLYGIAAGAVVIIAAALLILFSSRRTGEVTEVEEMAIEAVQDRSYDESSYDETVKTEQAEPARPDYIRITILDIYLLTNRIARENGYRELESPAELGRDPDWIYPGNMFTLPDETVYEVVDGDTIWYIARRFIRKTLDQDWIKYDEIVKDIEKSGSAADDRERQLRSLNDLKEGSYSENFKREIDRTIARIRAPGGNNQ